MKRLENSGAGFGWLLNGRILKKVFMTKKVLSFLYAVCTLLLLCGVPSVAEDGWKEYVGPEMVQLLDSAAALPASFYVSPEGNDAWSGRLAAPGADGTDGPFRSLERARDAVRQYRAGGAFDGTPTVVEVLPGLYRLEKTWALTADDSGTSDSPVIWRGTRGEGGRPLAVLRGGPAVSGGRPVSDAAVLERLKQEVRGHVLEYDLKPLGVTEYGPPDGENGTELFFQGRPMTPARYPNEGYITFTRVEDEDGTVVTQDDHKEVYTPNIFADGELLARWSREPDLWTLGYWRLDWAYSRQKVAQIDLEKNLMRLAEPNHGYGYAPGQYYYVYHALCELDAPGEYYIDKESGKLYFYPPEESGEGDLYLSMLDTLIEGNEAEHLVLTGLCLEGCRADAIRMNGRELLLSGLVIRNTGGAGIRLAGDRCLVYGSYLRETGGAGINLNAGNRADLRLGASAAVNNDIERFGRVHRAYHPALSLNGCGLLAERNRLTDAPHAAIIYNGNEIRIERNEIARVCEESNDAGAIYTGRDWTTRGNLIRQNYFHDISGRKGYGCVGVYLDDMSSSTDVTENLFVNVTRAAMIGGGRDNSVVNNLFVDCEPNIHIDGRALGWAHACAENWLTEIEDRGTLSGIDYKSEIWASKYPRLAAITEGNPKAPEGNLIERNLVISTRGGNGGPEEFLPDALFDEARPYVHPRDNVRADIRFLLNMKPGEKTPLPGTNALFDPIPTGEIGVFGGYGAVSR